MEQETALYDRQITVWGADTQRRLSKSHILVCGMKGAVAEFCKNIVLAGVGSLTLVDARTVTEEALSADFLILPDEKMYGGKTIAEVVCCDSLKEFNPMVRVSVEKGNLSSFGGEFYDKFDVIVVSCSPSQRKASPSKRDPIWEISDMLLTSHFVVNSNYQEVMKAVSGKGVPVKNFLLFDVMDGKGIVEDIFNPNTGS